MNRGNQSPNPKGLEAMAGPSYPVPTGGSKVTAKVQIHPLVQEEIEKISDSISDLLDVQQQFQDAMTAQKKKRRELEKEFVSLVDMPGKRQPFKYQINIPITDGSKQAVTGATEISRDGPFVVQRLRVSAYVTEGPIFLDEPGYEIDFSYMIGRYIPLSSRGTYDKWGYAFGAVGADFFPEPGDRFTAPPIDFEWTLHDGGAQRNHQDKKISGDILDKHDQDGIFMNNQIWASGSKIYFTVCPLRELLYYYFYLLGQGWDEPQTFTWSVMVNATFDGYKIVQPGIF